MTSVDISEAATNLKLLNSFVAKKYKDWDRETRKITIEEIHRRLRLEKKITNGNLPENYQTLIAETGGCGPDSVYFYPRPLVVEVAIFENTGTNVVDVSDFIGTTLNAGLRSSRRIKGGTTSFELEPSAFSLAPAERALITLKLIFVVNPALRSEAEAGGQVATRFSNFDYGPELVISAFSASLETYKLTETSANFLSASLTSEGGSCPYIYAFNEELGDWANHQKVLHYANDASLEQSDTKTFKGLRTRFRLAELEPEVAHIDEAYLEIVLKDGRRRMLAPNIDALASADKRYVRLFWGEEIEFQFDVPEDIKAEQVDRSILHVTGYYDRYGKILAERNKLHRVKNLGRSRFQSYPSTSPRCSSRGS